MTRTIIMAEDLVVKVAEDSLSISWHPKEIWLPSARTTWGIVEVHNSASSVLQGKLNQILSVQLPWGNVFFLFRTILSPHTDDRGLVAYWLGFRKIMCMRRNMNSSVLAKNLWWRSQMAGLAAQKITVKHSCFLDHKTQAQQTNTILYG